MSTFTDTDITNSEVVDLYQFIYISRITSTGLSGASTLNDIAETSIKNNTINNITGILCYGNGYFFQYVEGTEQALTNLKNQLLMDDRHKDLQMLEFSEIKTRRFENWSLRSIVLEQWLFKDPNLKALLPLKPCSILSRRRPIFSTAANNAARSFGCESDFIALMVI